jgi:tungstate transport system substrate-binding protein
MTTAIALETSKENLPLALGLGIVLILTVVLISALAWTSGLPFISRGDRSGTHFAELNLWKQSGIDIENEKGQWYKSIGQGMGAALNTAAASDAYVLSDRATWIRFRNKGDLQILVEGDKRMFNQYGVMLSQSGKASECEKRAWPTVHRLSCVTEGQNAIANYKIDRQQLFYPNANDSGA